jgi:hypothetical protein
MSNFKNKLAIMNRQMVLKGAATLALMVAGITGVFAQNPITPETTALYKHTTNSTNLVGPVAGEAIDSVTTTSVMKYYVLPDINVNPGFVAPFTNLVSTFGWTTSVATGSAAGVIANVPSSVHANYQQVTWSGIGTINLNVVENSVSGCASGSTTTIPVSIINIPTVTGGAAPSAQCTSDPATVTFAVPLATLTSDISTPDKVRINYTVYNPDNTVLFPAANLDLAKGAATFNLTLTGATQYGAYKVTINSVSDRISRKSVVAGIVNTPNILLTVNRIPVTGPIYHLPNL